MIIPNTIQDLIYLDEKEFYKKIYAKEQKLKVVYLGGSVNFIDLEDDFTTYTFKHSLHEMDLMNLTFKLFNAKPPFEASDLDTCFYMLKRFHQKNNSDDEIVNMITQATLELSPIYKCLIDSENFKLEIKPWRGGSVFNPFVKEAKQNLETRMNISKLYKAIMAGQVEKVVCEGIYTDDWYRDDACHNMRGEWDPLDLADRIFLTHQKYYFTKNEDKSMRIGTACGDFSESFTITFK